MSTATQTEREWASLAPARIRAWKATLASALLLAVLLVADLVLGPKEVPIGAGEVGRVLLHHVPLLRAIPHAPPAADADTIVWQFRLPRAVVAALIGALLGLAGVALQGLLMNPLADPYTVGVSAGAAVGAALAEVLGWSALWMGFAVTGAAFATALGAVALVYALARVGGRVSVHTFLLAGVVVGTFLWSLIPLLMVLAGRAEDMARIFFYLIGSVQGADWPRAELLLPFLIIVAVCLRAWARDLNLMTLGEESAAHLGVEIESFKRRVLLAGSLATAAAVSVGGIIGFVGLVVPHVARRIVGPDHRALLPLAAIFGAILLVVSDTLVRVWLNEMPVGVVTSLVGAPFFCYLLRRRRAVAW
jgi:iron complex transport system permease protein